MRWWPYALAGLAIALGAAVWFGAAAFPRRSAPIPFETVEGLIVVQARINRGLPAAFVLDTGATVTLLNDRFVRERRLQRERNRAQLASIGSGALRPASLVRLERIEVGPATATGQRAVVQDLRTFERLLRRPVAGVLGYSFLGHYRLVIDYGQRRLWLE
jgi:predicted aspartyl protease